GVRRDLAVHQLHGDLALERRVERAIDGRHPPGPDLGLEAIPVVQAHADERAHRVACIVADSGTLVMRMPPAWRGGLVWGSPRGCRSPWNVYPPEAVIEGGGRPSHKARSAGCSWRGVATGAPAAPPPGDGRSAAARSTSRTVSSLAHEERLVGAAEAPA